MVFLMVLCILYIRTDPHFRALMRGITKRTVLYTEMVVDDTVLHSPNLDFCLGNYGNQHPSVIQLGLSIVLQPSRVNLLKYITFLGGSDPSALAQAAELCERYGGGYGEVTGIHDLDNESSPNPHKFIDKS